MKKIRYKITLRYKDGEEICSEIDQYIAALGIYEYFSDSRYWQRKPLQIISLEGRTVSTDWTVLKYKDYEKEPQHC